jgi:hypothetical protein
MDRRHIEQVPLHPFINARQAMPHGGVGSETLDRFERLNAGVKVLLSSGCSGMDGQATGISNRGSGGFIRKPFTLYDLSRKLSGIPG